MTNQTRISKTPVTILICFLLPFTVNAQPGGGGGFIIKHILNDNLQNICNDTSFKLRSFILTGSDPQSSIRSESDLSFREGNSLRVRGFENSIIREQESTHRLVIVYRKNIMIVDLLSVINANGMGLFDRLDSLVFRKGYFRYFRKPQSIYRGGDQDNDSRLLQRGFTPSVTKTIRKKGWLTYSRRIDTRFLPEMNLSPFYFLSMARENNRPGKYEEALQNVQKAMEMQMTLAEKELAFTILSEVYENMGKTEEAINAITEAILIVPDKYRWEKYYKHRIQLFISEKKYRQALDGYDSLVNMHKKSGEDYTPIMTDRAKFKMDHLYQYKEAIADFETILQALPNARSYYDEHSNIFYYFWIGVAEYRDGQLSEAFDHWLKAEDLQCLTYFGSPEPAHYDSVIQKYPDEALLYVCRAIAHRGRCYHDNRQTADSAIIQQALDDLAKAEQLGFKDYRIHLYKAACLKEIKNYKDALQQLNEGISKNQADKRLYIWRDLMRKKLSN